jgi:hypothetical protein
MLWVILIPVIIMYVGDQRRISHNHDKDLDLDLRPSLLRDFPCKESRGIWYKIQFEKGMAQVCISMPTQFEI